MQKFELYQLLPNSCFCRKRNNRYPTSISPPGITVYLLTVSSPRSDLTLKDEFSPGANIMNFAFSVEDVINLPLSSKYCTVTSAELMVLFELLTRVPFTIVESRSSENV